MKIIKTLQSGSLESSDILITLAPPKKKGIIIKLKSDIQEQFGEAIVSKIENTLKKLGIEDVICYAEDKGALDFTIIARVEAAVYSAKKEQEAYN
jgi:citrate lyase subunit gamma (acyl carrier protein)